MVDEREGQAIAHYVCVTGGRDYTDRDHVREVLWLLQQLYGEDLRVLHGAQRGADRLAHEVCVELDIRVKPFPADWATYGKPAGVIRNGAMATYLAMCRDRGHTVQVIAFPGGRGTNDMIAQAAQHGIEADRV